MHINAILSYLAACLMLIAAIKVYKRTSYTPSRLKVLTLVFGLLAVINVAGGLYFVFFEARTSDNMLMIVSGVTWALASGFFFAASRLDRAVSDV